MFCWLEVKRKALYMRLQEISLCVYTGLSKPQFLFILVQLNPLLTLLLNLNIQILSLKKKITYLAVWSLFKHMEINLKQLFNTGSTSLENSLISRKLFLHLWLFTISQWQSFILQREVPHPSTIKSTNSPFCVPTLPFILSLLLFKTNTFLWSFPHGLLSQRIHAVMILFSLPVVSLHLLPLIKTDLKTQSLSCGLQVLSCNMERFCILQLRFIASKLKKKKNSKNNICNLSIKLQWFQNFKKIIKMKANNY